MNIKELFNAVKFEETWSVLLNNYKMPESAKKDYEKTYEKLKDVDIIPTEDEYLIDAIWITDAYLKEKKIDAYLIKIKDLKEKFRKNEFYETNENVSDKTTEEIEKVLQDNNKIFPDSYSFDITEWGKVLGNIVNITNKNTSLAEKAGAIFFEMTFFGPNEEDSLNEINYIEELSKQIKEDIKKEENEEKVKHKYHTIDELFDVLDYHDERTEKEKENDLRKMLESSYQYNRTIYSILYNFLKDNS